MKRDEAQELLRIAQDELGGLPAAHQVHVLNIYAELHGFEDGQMMLGQEPPAAAPVPRATPGMGPKARASDPEGSHRAALDNAPRRESQRGRILETLCIAPSGIWFLAEQLAEQTGIPLNSVSTRMSELTAGGWVRDDGPKEQTKNGELATTYQASYKAMQRFHSQARQALAAA